MVGWWILGVFSDNHVPDKEGNILSLMFFLSS